MLVAHDPRWAPWAQRHLEAIRRALVLLVEDLDACTFDHIGSTAVPGLDAKAFVDLQARLPLIPPPADLDAALAPLGWAPALSSRPDSPGVTSDLPWPGDEEPAHVWAKRLFTTGGVQQGILHVRLLASPFGRRTVAFRDRLRAEPDLREEYAQLKHRLAAVHAGAGDYDDYTRDKSAFVRAAVTG